MHHIERPASYQDRKDRFIAARDALVADIRKHFGDTLDAQIDNFFARIRIDTTREEIIHKKVSRIVHQAIIADGIDRDELGFWNGATELIKDEQKYLNELMARSSATDAVETVKERLENLASAIDDLEMRQHPTAPQRGGVRQKAVPILAHRQAQTSPGTGRA